ncbi:MAG: UDP-N-acetylmuramate dehydrogenase [Acidimicrobiales bacterium]
MIDASSTSGPWSSTTRAARAELADTALFDVPLGQYCTYRVGGPAAALVEVGDLGELDRVAGVVARTGVATLIVGKGSNLLVADRGFDGLVIMLGPQFAAIEISDLQPNDGHAHDGVLVELGGATLLPVAARATVRAGLTGFEWAVGVPGTVGGAVRMNAGGHGADMQDSLVRAELLDLGTGERIWRLAGDLELGYRYSNVAANQVVTRAEIRLHPGTGDEDERLSEIVRWRRAHQPGGANAGSVFANPTGDSAGRMIDAAGLKGFRIGCASVSTKHANFIQVDPPGSADDVATLIDEVRDRVEAAFGVRLRAENRLVGFEPSTTQGEETATVDRP